MTGRDGTSSTLSGQGHRDRHRLAPWRRFMASRSTNSVIVSSTGALALRPGARAARGRRRRRDRARTRLGLAAARRAGDGHRVPRPHRRPGSTPSLARQFQRILEKQGIDFSLATKVTGVDSPPARRRRAASNRSPAAQRPRSRPTWCWSRSAAVPYTEGLGLGRDRRSRSTSAAASRSTRICHQNSRHLRHRRRDRRPDARPQGRGRRRRGRGDYCRARRAT